MSLTDISDEVYARRRKFLAYPLAAVSGYGVIHSFGYTFGYGEAQMFHANLHIPASVYLVVYFPTVAIFLLGCLPPSIKRVALIFSFFFLGGIISALTEAISFASQSKPDMFPKGYNLFEHAFGNTFMVFVMCIPLIVKVYVWGVLLSSVFRFSFNRFVKVR